MPNVFIIAEAGVNHNGSVNTAKKMVDAAVQAGADAVKFQTFKPELLVSKFAPKAGYQKRTTGKRESQLDMIQRLKLDFKAHQELLRYCRKKKIMFLSSPFDLESIGLLSHLGLSIFKIPSGEITNLPYLRKIGALRKKIIMSTGMADLNEIKAALDILLKCGTRKQDVTILQCNTEYPTPFRDANLLAMLTIKDRLGIAVGYSDHTPGIEAAVAAVALGARVIEKHFTLDKDMSGPDHQASLDPKELSDLVAAIRHVEMALGSEIKKLSPSEAANKRVARKSLVAAVDIMKGELFSECNLAVKRPGTGISPMLLDRVLGKKARRSFKKDELVSI